MTKEVSDMKGFSAYICFGKHGGWRIRRDGPSLRLTLGRVAIAIVFYDLEVAMKTLLTRCQEMEAEIAANKPSASA